MGSLKNSNIDRCLPKNYELKLTNHKGFIDFIVTTNRNLCSKDLNWYVNRHKHDNKIYANTFSISFPIFSNKVVMFISWKKKWIANQL